MIPSKLVDRLAIAAMFTVSVAVPLATLTPLGANAQARVPSSSAKFTVLARHRALGDDDFRQIRPGMTGSDVLALIGAPYAKIRFEATKTTAWDYHYRDSWNYDSDFSVILNDAGVVVSTFSTRHDQ